MPKINPENEARRVRRKELFGVLQEAGGTDLAGVKELFKEMVATVLENGLEGELEEELGYKDRSQKRLGNNTLPA